MVVAGSYNLKPLLTQFGACQAVAPLVKEVEAKGPVTVSFTYRKWEAPHGASLWLDERKIILLKSDPLALTYLLFEMINLRNTDVAGTAHLNICDFDRELYALDIEKLE